MHIESVSIQGFRCFGPDPMKVELSAEVTGVVGANASGKTALLMALARMFGVSRAQRTVVRSDFHTPVGADPEDVSRKDLSIEVVLALPELGAGDATAETVAPTFRHMQIEREGAAPACRICLEARWEDDGTVEGAVSQALSWLDTLDETPPEDARHPLAAADRGLIQLHYTPAARDAAAQVRASAGALAARLLRAIEWSDRARTDVATATTALTTTFEGEAGVAAIGRALQARWSRLYDEASDVKPRLSLVSRRFEEVLSRVAVVFDQAPDGQERTLEALSDGQQSLFYFALAAAVFDLEREVVAGEVAGFDAEGLRIPALTVFALEEPENHLSPFYLARIVSEVRGLAEAGGAQVLLTSHSPAVLSRVRPEEVRHARLDRATRTSTIRAIACPRRRATRPSSCEARSWPTPNSTSRASSSSWRATRNGSFCPSSARRSV